MIKILFVCTGNVFRSMIAEKCFNHFTKKNNILDKIADSAGTKTFKQSVHPSIIKRLKVYGIQSDHQYKNLNEDLINENDLIIAMSIDHRDFIKKQFNFDVPLFNEVAYGKREGILDFCEYNPKITTLADDAYQDDIRRYANAIVDYIYQSTPVLVDNINKWIN